MITTPFWLAWLGLIIQKKVLYILARPFFETRKAAVIQPIFQTFKLLLWSVYGNLDSELPKATRSLCCRRDLGGSTNIGTILQ